MLYNIWGSFRGVLCVCCVMFRGVLGVCYVYVIYVLCNV